MDQTIALLASAGAALLIDFDDHTSRPVPLGLSPKPDWRCSSPTPGCRTRWSTAGTPRGAPTARPRPSSLGVPSLRQATLSDVSGLSDERVRRRATHVVTEISRVRGAVAALAAGDWAAVGTLFRDSHVSMRDDFEISCPELDLAVTTAVEAGAIGARMTGGGFGGSTIALVPVDRLDAVVRAIDLAFVGAGFGAPQHLLAEPGPAAGLVP